MVHLVCESWGCNDISTDILKTILLIVFIISKPHFSFNINFRFVNEVVQIFHEKR